MTSISTGHRARWRPASLWGAAGLLLAVLVAAVMVIAADRYGRRLAVADLRARAEATLPLAVAALTGEISKQQLLPAVLALDSDVAGLLAAPDAERARRISLKLKQLAGEARASVVYLIGADGITVAASNFDAPDSFVGSDYGFRTYFTAAMGEGRGLQYALGTVSRRPGLYLSHRVDGPAGPLGVAVVKVELDRVEADWLLSGYTIFASDRQGIVLVTSRPGWRFGLLAPLADEAAARQALQIGDVPLAALPIRHEGSGLVLVDGEGRSARSVEAAGPVGDAAPGWRLTVLVPADAASSAAARTSVLTVLAALLALAALGIAIQRRRLAARRRQAALSEMNAELERRVIERTGELSRANTALAGEIASRESAEQRVRRLREDLAQANRLSILGQIAAGVAHEINQPVAAIRAYADNAGRFLDGGRPEPARDNMGAISRMADRIGEITGTLRGFARRATSPLAPVVLDEAIDGALSLLAGRIRDSGVAIVRSRAGPPPVVVASRIRLEQILVNLLQNALDALKGRPDGRITLTVESDDDLVRVTVADNGPGIPADVAETLFMPFVTTKEAGLGLGLVISGEIAREFGGALRHEAGTERGALFVLDLRHAR